MSNRTVRVVLEAQTGPYEAGMRRAAQATERVAAAGTQGQAAWGKFTSTIAANEKAANKVAGTLTGVGLAATAVGAAAVKAFADFDEAMSGVAVASGESGQALTRLREQAMQLGADTKFSATEAAQGMENLARAGVSTADILGGGIKGSLDLAAAGQMQVADAAELAAVAMTQFKLAGKDVPHIADLLAAGAGKAMGDVSDLGMALKQSGLVASQFGLSIEETVGGLSAFAQAGLLGSDAGTSFKSMLLRLANPSKESARLMEELGINAYDAQGQFVGLEGLAGQLQTQLSSLSDAQRQSALATIFGSDAIRAASILYENGAQGIAGWTEAVNQQGYAAEQAAGYMNNLKGDLEELGGSVNTFAIKMGSAADGPLRAIVQGLTEFINILGETPGLAQGIMVTTGALAGLSLAAAGLVKGVQFAQELRAALLALGATEAGLSKASSALGAVGKHAGIAAASIGTILAASRALQEIFPEYDALNRSFDDLARQMKLIGAGGADIDSMFSDNTRALFQLKEGGFSAAEALRGLAEAQDSVGFAVDRFMADLTGIQTLFTENERRVRAYGEQLANLPLPEAQRMFAKLRDAAVEGGMSMEQLIGYTDAYADSVEVMAAEAGAAELSASELAQLMSGEMVRGLQLSADGTRLLSSEQAAAEQAAGGMSAAQEQAAEAAAEQAKALKDAADAAIAYYQAVLSAESSNIALEAAIDDASSAVSKNGQSLDINSDKGRANREALLAVASAALRVAQDMAEAGASTDEVSARTAYARGEFVKVARQMGMSESAAAAYADQLGLIPDDVATRVTTPGAEDAKRRVQDLTRVIGAVPKSTSAHVNVNVNAGGLYALNNTLNSINGRTYTAYASVRTYGQGAVAVGGYGHHVADAIGLARGGVPRRRVAGLLEGPGTPTSDSIPAWLSRREFVTRAAAVDHYGVDAMYAINAKAVDRGSLRALLGLPVTEHRFAQGGSPGYRQSPAPAVQGQVTQYVTLQLPEWVRDVSDMVAFLRSPQFAAHMAGGVS